VPHQLKLLGLATALALTAGCEKEVEAPTTRKACFHMVPLEEAPPKFNRLPGSYESMEYCAAALEMVRLQGRRQQITGSFQGQFIFATSRGIFVGQGLDGPRYLALVRTGDGRLAVPGAVRR
jgi:hypothetical protein